LHRTSAKWSTIIQATAILRVTAAILRVTTDINLRATADILRAIPAILWESCGIILASFTILVGSVKNRFINLLQFSSTHVPIPH
jgi:hypothetical protein